MNVEIRPLGFRIFRGIALLSCLLGAAVGCGKRYGTVPVEGVVTFAGSPPAALCTLVFVPDVTDGIDGRWRAGRADTDASGRFSAASYKPGDGLLPGRYTVEVQCWKTRPSHENEKGVSLMPPGFQPPPLVVPEGARSVQYVVDVVPAKKPGT